MIVKVILEDNRVIPVPLKDKVWSQKDMTRVIKSILLVHYEYSGSFKYL
jgi:hypothetical protein